MGPRPHPALFNISDISLFFFLPPSGGDSLDLNALQLFCFLIGCGRLLLCKLTGCVCANPTFVCSQAEPAVGGHVIRGSSDPPSLFDLIAGSAGRGRGPG